MICRFLRRLTIRRRAFRLGARMVDGLPPWKMERDMLRHLIRINRIKNGLAPYSWDGEPRRVGQVFECRTALHSYGNVVRPPTFPESVRDLVAYNGGVPA